MRFPRHDAFDEAIQAAGRGSITTLRCSLERGCPLNNWVTMEAARGGHLNLLQWLARWIVGRPEHEFCCLFNDAVWTTAAEKGDIAIVKWGLSRRAIRDGRRCSESAALRGHLRFLQWARRNGFVMDDWWITEAAATNGHLETLKWLVSVGCPVNTRVVLTTVVNRQDRCLAFLADEGHVLTEQDVDSVRHEYLSRRFIRGEVESETESMVRLKAHVAEIYSEAKKKQVVGVIETRWLEALYDPTRKVCKSKMATRAAKFKS